MIAQVHGVIRRLEDRRRRHQQLGPGVGIVRGIGGALGQRQIAGLGDEARELAVRDGVTVHPEAVDSDPMGRRLFGIVMIGTHQEGPARDPDHVVCHVHRAPHCRGRPSLRSAG
jgi:hypothetical protein